jgi:hypothetical protein
LRLKQIFDAKVRPKPSDCLKVIKGSLAENGLIGRRKDVLKKKVFRMIDTLLVWETIVVDIDLTFKSLLGQKQMCCNFLVFSFSPK